MADPLQPRSIEFYGDEIIAVQHTDGVIYVLFSRMCENIGRARVTETRRVQDHTVLSQGLVEITAQTSGGPQSLLCLRLDLIPLWLASIPSQRIKEEYKEKLARYQTEAAAVLWQAFKPQIIVQESTPELVSSTDADLVQLTQIAEMGRAITRMAEEQLEIRRRMDAAARAFQRMRTDIVDMQVRIGVLEDRVHPAAFITDAQATEISNRVKALAELLTGRDSSKNHYQGIFGEIYRRFGVSSYKSIRLEQYEAVLAFLEDWRKATGAGAET